MSPKMSIMGPKMRVTGLEMSVIRPKKSVLGSKTSVVGPKMSVMGSKTIKGGHGVFRKVSSRPFHQTNCWALSGKLAQKFVRRVCISLVIFTMSNTAGAVSVVFVVVVVVVGVVEISHELMAENLIPWSQRTGSSNSGVWKDAAEKKRKKKIRLPHTNIPDTQEHNISM